MLEEERGSKQRARAAALCRKMQVRWWIDLVGWLNVGGEEEVWYPY